jgi:hypothetical protein
MTPKILSARMRFLFRTGGEEDSMNRSTYISALKIHWFVLKTLALCPYLPHSLEIRTLNRAVVSVLKEVACGQLHEMKNELN